MPTSLLLTLTIFVPVGAYLIARRTVPQFAYRISGVVFGAVVTLFAFGLYSWFFFSPIGIIPGAIGLALLAIHEPPGYYVAINLGLISKGEIVSGLAQRATVEGINAVIWSICYGLLGLWIDKARERKRSR